MSESRKVSNYSMRNWLESTETILGINGLKSILNHSNLQKYVDNFPPANYELQIPEEDVKNLFSSLVELFGKKGCHSLQLRMGREMARSGIEKYNQKVVKALLLAARLLPKAKKMWIALNRFKEVNEQAFPNSIDIQEENDCFLMTHRGNFESEGATSEVPVCGVLVGTIEYLMEWITGHKHEVKEIECRAMGHPADVIRISKTIQE